MASGDDSADTFPADGRPRSPVQQRLHDGFRTDRRYLSQMVVKAQDERSARVQAVLELKQDLDTSSARIGAKSSAIQTRDKAEKVRQARTHQNLLDQGKNPYEIARRKVVQREARKERAKIERNIQDREAKLLERLEEEKVVQRRRDKVEAENRAYEKKYQREMGHAAQEERTAAYLLSRTGKEALDPTGKMVRVYPSQETTMKDNSFGLGRSAVISSEHRRRVVAKMLVKHGEVTPSSMLLSRKKREQTELKDHEDPAVRSGRTDSDEKHETMPSLVESKPGQESRKVNHAMLLNNDVKLPPISKGFRRSQDPRDEDGENQTQDAPTKRKLRGRSVLEERQLTKARQRQKDSRFTQSQVVWGKTFTGNAFLATPELLWFKDFDVGRPLTLGFTLTNVSNTFNQFRLLPMEDEVIELFDIVYEKPGRMSAGMSCSLKVTFTGIEESDLDTFLSVAAPTGVFQIPVRCSCKKSVPKLSQNVVQFPEIIAGERTTIGLTLSNDGALPLRYRVRRLTVESENESDEEAEHEVFAEIEANEDLTDAQVEEDTDGNPQEDSGEHEVDPDIDIEGQPVESVTSRTASRANSASTTKTAATLVELPKTILPTPDEDLLSPEEQKLIDSIQETTRLKSERAEEPVRYTRQGVVVPYSKSTVSFTFTPATAVTLENEPFIVEFPSTELSSIPILVSGVAFQVPIFVAQSRLDFRCCAYGKLYRQQLMVCNRGKVAMKIQVQVPKALTGYVEFNPSFGFVQAVDSQIGKFPVQIKFRPDQKMWKRIERAGWGSQALGMLAVPVQVVIPNQVVPVYFFLTARLTSAELQLEMLQNKTPNSDRQLNFGVCCVGHSASVELKVTNLARVPQRVGVTSLPKDVAIADASEGVGMVLLPGEERILHVVYSPSFPGVLGSSGRAKPVLTLWSSTFNREYTLQCSGSGVASDLVFSQSAIRLGATSLGQIQTCNMQLTNQSDRHSHVVELRVPPEAAPFLKVTPIVARLEPLQTVRLEIDFEPIEDIFRLVKSCYFESKIPEEDDVLDPPLVSARSVHEDLATGSQNEDPNVQLEPLGSDPRSCHHTWTILCFQQQDDKKQSNFPPLQALEVRTTVVEPFLIPSTTNLDFGQVAIGQTLVRDLMLETTPYSTGNVSLRAQPLHILGAFRIIGALREVPASSENRKKRAIRVEFEPQTPLQYEDELELSALGVNIRVKLRGEGINPSLTLTPADGKVEFPDVLARTRNSRELLLANGSAFPLAFSFVNEDGNSLTSTGLPAFTFSPTNGIIPANDFLAVQVIFQPDHQRPGHYWSRYRIKVPNESEQHLVEVSGRCWENQVYVFAPSGDPGLQPLLNPSPVEDLFDVPPSVSLNQLPIGVNELPAVGLKKPTCTVMLTFTGAEDAVDMGRKRTLFVGCTTSSNGVYGGLDDGNPASSTAGGSGGSFELLVDAASPYANYFTLEPARGAIAAGQQLAIQVTYNPPAPTVASADITTTSSSARTGGAVALASARRPELEIVQWVNVRVQCILKGGALWRTIGPSGGTPANAVASQQKGPSTAGTTPDGADTCIVTVVLRARLET
ncbi:Cilia- and flagella-associated protein 74 [Phytophthora citrophthora]|uniref:Cilia- and flagella-associated protein 74 n=1 Tax=Phytophthora citrophthora TaxID=4793 RepID=A0AAD9G2Z2_9STRA|nr:Cilia- and flagella-associated protein 74 [Phytophthora citrophthora]